MFEFYTATMPKARKRHKCDLCGKWILPGERYYYTSGKYEGEYITWKNCLTCENIARAYCDHEGENEYTYEEVADYLEDTYCIECEHSRWNNDDCENVTDSEVRCPKIRELFKDKENSNGK